MPSTKPASPKLAKAFLKAIDAFMKANPNLKISGQPGEFNTYWDKLATQTAGSGEGPDHD